MRRSEQQVRRMEKILSTTGQPWRRWGAAWAIVAGIGVSTLLAFPTGASTLAWYRFETSNGAAGSPGGTIARLDDSGGAGLNSLGAYGTASFSANIPGSKIGTDNGATYLAANNLSASFPAAQTTAFNLRYGGGLSPFAVGDMTVEFFVDLSSLPAAASTRTVVYYQKGGSAHHFEINFVDLGANRYVRADLVGVENGYSGGYFDENVTSLTGWHEFAFVLKKGVSAQWFIDGVGLNLAMGNYGSTEDIYLPGYSDPAWPTVTAFGAQNYDQSGGWNLANPFEGTIDEFRWSNQALTPDQFLFASVPEPSVMLLLGLGAVVLAWRRRRG